MRILLVHNRYQQKGGEDAVALSEKNLLARYGEAVELLEVDNDNIVNFRGKLAASMSVFYSPHGVNLLNDAIAKFMPDVVHVHNWFPSLSPGVFWACKKKKIPVVHTLHNYRLLCASPSLFREGVVCEDCIGTTLRIPGVVHGCYRGSRSGTAIATAGMLVHWKYGTWSQAVDKFIALSNFAKMKLIEGGLPAAKIVVKPNFLDYDPGFRPGGLGYFLFVGRLAEQKGISILLNCWRECPDLPLLRIVGSGPLEEFVREMSESLHNVEYLGPRNAEEVRQIMGGAEALLCPSLGYEGMPLVVIEAMAVGTPVIASRLGSYLEMIAHGKTGMLFDIDDPQALPACIRQVHRNHVLAGMREEARKGFESRYTSQANFAMLRKIYEDVIYEQVNSAFLINKFTSL